MCDSSLIKSHILIDARNRLETDSKMETSVLCSRYSVIFAKRSGIKFWSVYLNVVNFLHRILFLKLLISENETVRVYCLKIIAAYIKYLTLQWVGEVIWFLSRLIVHFRTFVLIQFYLEGLSEYHRRRKISRYLGNFLRILGVACTKKVI